MEKLNTNQSQLRKDSPIQLLLMILLNRQRMGGAAKHVDGPPKLRKLHQFENMLNFTLRVFHLNVSFVTNHSGLEMPCTRINRGVIKKLEVGGWWTKVVRPCLVCPECGGGEGSPGSGTLAQPSMVTALHPAVSSQHTSGGDTDFYLYISHTHYCNYLQFLQLIFFYFSFRHLLHLWPFVTLRTFF